MLRHILSAASKVLHLFGGFQPYKYYNSTETNITKRVTMTANEYHFITYWRVEGTLQEVADIIGNGPDLVRWWPSVYLDVKQLEPGDENGLGRVVSLYTKGWLPYTLRWQFRVIEITSNGFTLEAWGDFVGQGKWTFEQDGSMVNIRYNWKIRADKSLLRYFSFIIKPIFSANHHWAMSKGEESLKLELMRRHSKTPYERARIPEPPPATTTSPIPLMAASLITLLIGVVMLRRIARIIA
jgi:hypothetical protein